MVKKLAPLFALGSTLALSGCGLVVLDPKGPIAAQDMQILVDSVAIMLVIVVPTIVAIAAFAWWYRADNPRARRRPDFAYSGQIELVVWSIPLLTVMLLSGVIWIGSHKLDPAEPLDGPVAPVRVQVVSLDWKWLFIYPDQNIVSVNELVVPVGAPLKMELTSGSVMTAFFVPQWGSMIYTMNAMTSHLNLRADEAGDYLGIAAMISGAGFSDMNFRARAMTPDAFAQWTKDAAAGPAFDEAAYKELAKQGSASKAARPLADSHLFEDIVSQKLAPAPGPSASVN
jgi:cytochrome o ubiquinol oxidase subunit 2